MRQNLQNSKGYSESHLSSARAFYYPSLSNTGPFEWWRKGLYMRMRSIQLIDGTRYILYYLFLEISKLLYIRKRHNISNLLRQMYGFYCFYLNMLIIFLANIIKNQHEGAFVLAEFVLLD